MQSTGRPAANKMICMSKKLQSQWHENGLNSFWFTTHDDLLACDF
jgi:hypothetical protein